MEITVKAVAAMIDHTNLKAFATWEDFEKQKRVGTDPVEQILSFRPFVQDSMPFTTSDKPKRFRHPPVHRLHREGDEPFLHHSAFRKLIAEKLEDRTGFIKENLRRIPLTDQLKCGGIFQNQLIVTLKRVFSQPSP